MQGDEGDDSDVDLENPFGEFGIEEDIDDDLHANAVQQDEGKATGAVSGISISMDVSAAPQELECNSSGMDCPMSTIHPAPEPSNLQDSQANAVELTTQLEPGHTGVCPGSAAGATEAAAVHPGSAGIPGGDGGKSPGSLQTLLRQFRWYF